MGWLEHLSSIKWMEVRVIVLEALSDLKKYMCDCLFGWK